MDRVMIISSDGHASARMPDYRTYLESEFHEDFDEFLAVYRQLAPRDFDRPATKFRLDPDVFDPWMETTGEQGRLDGNWDIRRRLQELEAEGVVAEVLFPDFGRAFERVPPLLAAALKDPPASDEHVAAGNRAYNRWLVDFCAEAPERLYGMAVVDFVDVDAALQQITWAKNVGLKGVILPMFHPGAPLYSPQYEPIWHLLEELELPVNSHAGMSAVTTQTIPIGDVPHPACALPMISSASVFACHEVLGHLIWGGVLERHPNLTVVFTEQGSDWVVGALRAMDYSYDGSYLRRDIRASLPHKPSSYFARQCFLGSSVFSRAEIEHRDEIGIAHMMVGVDYPHHEGNWSDGVRNYLQATLGMAEVSVADARLLLGETAARVFGFDVERLRPLVEAVGPTANEILTKPTKDSYPRGDVHRPFV